MKKLVMLIGSLCFATTALAQTEHNTLPKMNFGVFDISNKVVRKLENNRLSIAKAKDQTLCWAVFDMPLSGNNQVTEVFRSPSAMQFVDRGTSKVSTDKMVHTLKNQIKSTDNGASIQKCWSFDHTDPKGKYTLDLQVNDIVFPTQQFEITQ